MKYNLPSVKTLEAAFPGKGKALRKTLECETTVNEHPVVIELRKTCYSEPRLSHCRLVALNAELEGYGVEHVRRKVKRFESFDYINMGDVYNATIVRFECGRYRVTDIGSIIARGNYE